VPKLSDPLLREEKNNVIVGQVALWDDTQKGIFGMNLPFKVNERERKYLIYGGVIVVLIMAFYIISWYTDLRSGIDDISEAKSMMIEKQLGKIAQKDSIIKRAAATRKEIERQEKALLKGGKPPVAAAALQRALKEMASSLSIDIKLERTVNPVDADIYLGIPVEIGFKASTVDLKSLLVKISKSPYLLMVSEMKVRVTNISRPEDVYTTLVVTGFIKKLPKENEEMKEEKNGS
jgi:hypothetical protein